MKEPKVAPSLRARSEETVTNGTLGRAGQLAVVGLVAAGTFVAAASQSGLALVLFIPFAAVGALLVVRRPRTSIGWILLGLAWGGAVIIGTVHGTVQQFSDGTVNIPAELLAVVQGGSGPALYYLLAVLAIVFPSGRLPTGPWGGLARVALATGLILVAAAYVMPVISVSLAGYAAKVPVRNPIALLPDLAIWRVITLDTAFFPVVILVIAGAASLVFRLRRARGTERQQLRWFAASIAFVVAAVLCGFAIGFLLPGASESGLAWIPVIVAFTTVPVAVGIAVLRYHLYEIDRIISRTLAYAVLTVLLVGVYVAGFLLVQTVLASFMRGGGPVAVAASTLVVFALFQPLRRRIQAAMDRRFNRTRYDAQRTVEAFAAQLRDEVDLERLRVALVDSVEDAVRPVSATVWLRVGSGGR
jgi:hypothetical protein